MSKPPTGRMPAEALHDEIRTLVQLVSQPPHRTEENFRRLDALTAEFGKRMYRLRLDAVAQQHRLVWWRTATVAVVAFAFCVISILIALMLTRGA